MLKIKYALANAIKFQIDGAPAGSVAVNAVTPADSGQADLLAGIEITEEKKAALLADPALKGILESLISSKRNANKEAKDRGDELKILRAEKSQRDKDSQDAATKQAEEKGQFQDLYTKSNAELEALKNQFSKQAIDNQISKIAAKEGIKKDEYIKLFDVAGLEKQEDGTLKGLDAKFLDFKKSNLDLFKSNLPAVTPTNAQPNYNGVTPVPNAKKVYGKSASFGTDLNDFLKNT